MFPSHRTLYPASPSLQWVAWVSPKALILRFAVSYRNRIPCKLFPLCFLSDSASWIKDNHDAPGFYLCGRIPYTFSLTRRQMALSSSQVIPLNICPARNYRPRWCLINSPNRLQDFCRSTERSTELMPKSQRRSLPTKASCRLSPSDDGLSNGHNYTYFSQRDSYGRG
jgi:hypothetical protein